MPSLGNSHFIGELEKIVGRRHVLTKPGSTIFYRKGYRFGSGPALAVVRPGSLAEQWRVLRLCASANKIIIMQASNTGLTGGSTPNGTDYDRDVVIISTRRMNRITAINSGHQVICYPGATLFALEKLLKPMGRTPHSVIGSSCIGASIIGGISNNSGGSLIQRGPAYTQMSLFARIGQSGNIQLINHLGVHLGESPERILSTLDDNKFVEEDIEYNSSFVASDAEYKDHVRDVDANTPARYNADSRRLFESSGSAGKIVTFAVRLDTFPIERHTQFFYIGTNDPDELSTIRRHVLTQFKSLPVSGEYMDRTAFDIAETYGKDMFLLIWYVGTRWLPSFFALKTRFDTLVAHVWPQVSDLSDKILQEISKLSPKHLPKRIRAYRNQYRHHMILKMSDGGIEEARQYFKTLFPSEHGNYFECSAEEGDKASLHRFVVAGAAIRYHTLNRRTVEDVVALDIALRRDDQDWMEKLPPDIDSAIIHKVYYGHFFCHVFHQDYIIRKGHHTGWLKQEICKLLDARGAHYPAEHNFGHLYEAPAAVVEHYKTLDPRNCLNSGIGGTAKKLHWSERSE